MSFLSELKSRANALQGLQLGAQHDLVANTLTPDHDGGRIAFRVSNVGGFGVLNTVYPAAQLTPPLMDELAKKLLGQPSRFG